jgi:hypothetical protein
MRMHPSPQADRGWRQALSLLYQQQQEVSGHGDSSICMGSVTSGPLLGSVWQQQPPTPNTPPRPPFCPLLPAGKYASTVVTGVKYDKAVATG